MSSGRPRPSIVRLVRVALSLGLLLLSGLSFGAAGARSEGLDREARLTSALADYATALGEADRDARLAGFARAEQGFASLVADGVESAPLWTNLGNAALQAEHTGQAVLAYHRALRLDPDHATARQNLTHVRARLPSWVPRPDAAEGARSFFFEGRIAPAERGLAAAICFVVAAASIALSVRRREGAWRGLAILSGVAWAVLVGSIFYEARSGGDDRAVITSDETPARSADSTLAPLALPDPLPAGVEVDRLEVRSDWTRVRLANGRDVWVRSSSVTPVSG